LLEHSSPAANQVIPGQTVDPSIPGASLGQKALLAKKFAQQTKYVYRFTGF